MRLDPRKVANREDFVGFVRDLRASLANALREPAPPNYVDLRGEFWINWDSRLSFWEAMTACLEDSHTDSKLFRESPLGRSILEPVPPAAEHGLEGSAELCDFLQVIEDRGAMMADQDPDVWKRAAETLLCGSTYE